MEEERKGKKRKENDEKEMKKIKKKWKWTEKRTGKKLEMTVGGRQRWYEEKRREEKI